VSNAGQAAGDHRVRYAGLFDAEVRAHNERFRAVAKVGRGDRVLDVGCGTGESSRDAARAAVAGRVVGVDLSAAALELARRLSAEQGLSNVTFLQADAQVHAFPPQHFDLCISRFGTMFFADPVAAFTNIGGALGSAARLVLLVWHNADRNEWFTAVHQAITDSAAPTLPAGGQHPFALADPAVTQRLLAASGFADVEFTEVNEPVYYGPDRATAFDFVLGLRSNADLLADLDPEPARNALERLHATIAAHETGTGVYFDAHAWIITARHP
jgi:SAM-dependent methyltransferase